MLGDVLLNPMMEDQQALLALDQKWRKLEDNVIKLRNSLRHWQQWEIEYESMVGHLFHALVIVILCAPFHRQSCLTSRLIFSCESISFGTLLDARLLSDDYFVERTAVRSWTSLLSERPSKFGARY